MWAVISGGSFGWLHWVHALLWGAACCLSGLSAAIVVRTNTRSSKQKLISMAAALRTLKATYLREANSGRMVNSSADWSAER